MNITINVSDDHIKTIINAVNRTFGLSITLELVKGDQELFEYLMNGSSIENFQGESNLYFDPNECDIEDCFSEIHEYI